MKRKKITALFIITFLLMLFSGISIMGLEKATPENPIGLHTDSIKTENNVSKPHEEGADTGENNSFLNKEKKGDQARNHENNGNSNENQSEKTKSDANEDDKKDDGNIDGMNDSDQADDKEGNGNTAEESNNPADNRDASIVTDLKNQTVTEKQLKEHTLAFYAYLSKQETDKKLKVKIRNDNTPINGKYLASERKDYETKLAKGYNYITLYLKENGETIYQITYAINYVSDKADEDNPIVGEHPPLITTNLDGRSKTIKNRNFVFTASAFTYKGKYLPYDNIRVTFDGKAVRTTPTGTDTYEYDLYFKNPRIGDRESHVVTVMAWDNEGNARFKKYVVVYEATEEGEVIGNVTVNVDATTIGLGIIASGQTCEIRQDEPASVAVMECMENYGFSVGHGGTVKSGFYLKSLSAGYIANGAKIPGSLKKKIDADGLNMTGQHSKNKIAEFDYTEGSGWMYTIDGTLYPGRGLSNYYLEDGDIVTLRFTLAYGKDLGSSSNRGLLSSYCGSWINGSYRPNHKMGSGKITKEPTCIDAGLKETKCRINGCDEKISESIKALGHDFREVSRRNATVDEEGEIRYECNRCSEVRTESIPKIQEYEDDEE